MNLNSLSKSSQSQGQGRGQSHESSQWDKIKRKLSAGFEIPDNEKGNILRYVTYLNTGSSKFFKIFELPVLRI